MSSEGGATWPPWLSLYERDGYATQVMLMLSGCELLGVLLILSTVLPSPIFLWSGSHRGLHLDHQTNVLQCGHLFACCKEIRRTEARVWLLKRASERERLNTSDLVLQK